MAELRFTKGQVNDFDTSKIQFTFDGRTQEISPAYVFKISDIKARDKNVIEA